MAYIYKITNKLNGKIYVGKRVKENAADIENYYGSGIAIKAAIEKYGKENFTKDILEWVPVTENCKELCDREKFWIKTLQANVPNIGYNLTAGGDGSCSPEAARKGAETRKRNGYKHSEETKQKMREAALGRKFSDEHKQTLSLHHHLRTLHRVLFEKDDSIVETYEPLGDVAFKYLGTYNSSALVAHSKRNEFFKGIKLLEYVK